MVSSQRSNHMVCFLDCDGVLADFIQGCCGILGTDRDSVFKDRPRPLPFMLKDLFGEENESRLYGEMTPEFWANLPKHEWADDLVEMLSDVYKDNLYLCTSAGYLGTSNYFRNAVLGKEQWVLKHYPKFAKKTIFCYDKIGLASDRHVLIDDSEPVVDRFTDAGGAGVLFPADWNSKWPFASMPTLYLKNLIF